MGYQGEGKGEVGREMIDMSGQAEQGLGKRFGKMDEREFGNMEKEVTRKGLGEREFGRKMGQEVGT